MNGQQTDAQRLLFYLTMLQEDLTPELAELEKKALASDVPIVRKDTQMFLRLLLQMNRPKRILEIGTAVGFSALLMASYTSAETSIVTLENYQKRIALAKENIRSFGMEDRIRLIEGDAATTLQEMSKSGTEPFDFVFIDAAKAQYSVYFELLRSLTKSQTGPFIKECGIICSGFVMMRIMCHRFFLLGTGLPSASENDFWITF